LSTITNQGVSMQLKASLAALALSAMAGSAVAVDYDIGNLSTLTSFSDGSTTFAAGEAISDNWFFSIGPLPADFSGLVSSVYTQATGLIEDFAVTLAGPEGYLASWTPFTSGGVSGFQWAAGVDTLWAGDYTLTVTGTARGVTTYSVDFTAAPIPEPETYALMLAGLGVVGYIARRRRNG
jgi:hypothetical protein